MAYRKNITPSNVLLFVRQADFANLTGFYAREIQKEQPQLTARQVAHVEAWMRLEHASLNGLSRQQARKEIAIALECMKQSSESDNESLAESFGL